MKLLVLIVCIIALVANTFALKNEICGLPHSRNGDGKRACMGFFPSWSYNSDKNECIEFIYGGCGGNDNRFGSKELCEDKCLE
ncbi:male accessory gland serine protease inhibitor-like [Drosophila elegans]|uniref:male accessory gland serine protease inhibitor-like n=1 Tax=Drosophila elegans TaxID=30023 RepID=UPI0007E7A0A3|nr:male accessory gland serine protease inhibitor-like [Drosophila elegans]